MATDASVVALMNHLNEVDRRRRITTMNQREMDAKLTHVSQERKELERQKEAMLLAEKELRQELDVLAGQQKQVQLQLLMESDRVRHAEVEEPLLHASAKEALDKVLAELAQWKDNHNQLEALMAAWQSDPCMRGVRQSLADVDAQVSDLRARHAAVEEETVELRLKCTQARNAIAAGSEASKEAGFLSSGAVLTGAGAGAPERDGLLSADGTSVAASATTDGASVSLLQERLTQAEEDLARLEASQGIEKAAVQREVDDMTGRIGELRAMLADVQQCAADLESNTKELSLCVSRQRCRKCWREDKQH